MTPRENLHRLYHRRGYESVPVYFVLCPELENTFKKRYPNQGSYEEVFDFPVRVITDPGFPWIEETQGFIPEREWDWKKYYPKPVKPGARIDIWGTAHEPGSRAAKHMTHMRHPLETIQSIKELETYPWPDFYQADFSVYQNDVQQIHNNDLAVHIWMECTIWETAWYMRGMENLMVDMATESDIAFYILDKITDLACYRAREYAKLGADILALGDDIGTQESILMSVDMYRRWLKPRLMNVIEAAKSTKPDIVIQYHSCGHIEPFIPDLIDAGVDVLDPVQPECNDFQKIHQEYGDILSFHGTLGTQQTMPFGTTKDVKKVTRDHLQIAGKKGGLFVCPTHMLEPEVPWENVEAYVDACRQFSPS